MRTRTLIGKKNEKDQAKRLRKIKNGSAMVVAGNEAFATIHSDMQATIVSNGTELETIVYDEMVSVYERVENIDMDAIKEKISSGLPFYGKLTVTVAQLKEAGLKLESKDKINVDIIWFDGTRLFIGEIKTGEDFDTKKAPAEIESLNKVREYFISNGVESDVYMILWACQDLKNSSIKSKGSMDILLRGRDFCDKVGISFDSIQKEREADQKDNEDYLVRLAAPAVYGHESFLETAKEHLDREKVLELARMFGISGDDLK